MSPKVGKIIIPAGIKSKPRQHEINVANILALHLQTDIEFIPADTHSSADFLINGVQWELKSPQGTGKNNIERQLKYAWHQSPNVIIDASRSRMHPARMKREVETQFRMIKSVKRLLYVSKDKQVIEIFR